MRVLTFIIAFCVLNAANAAVPPIGQNQQDEQQLHHDTCTSTRYEKLLTEWTDMYDNMQINYELSLFFFEQYIDPTNQMQTHSDDMLFHGIDQIQSPCDDMPTNNYQYQDIDQMQTCGNDMQINNEQYQDIDQMQAYSVDMQTNNEQDQDIDPIDQNQQDEQHLHQTCGVDTQTNNKQDQDDPSDQMQPGNVDTHFAKMATIHSEQMQTPSILLKPGMTNIKQEKMMLTCFVIMQLEQFHQTEETAIEAFYRVLGCKTIFLQIVNVNTYFQCYIIPKIRGRANKLLTSGRKNAKFTPIHELLIKNLSDILKSLDIKRSLKTFITGLLNQILGVDYSVKNVSSFINSGNIDSDNKTRINLSAEQKNIILNYLLRDKYIVLTMKNKQVWRNKKTTELWTEFLNLLNNILGTDIPHSQFRIIINRLMKNTKFVKTLYKRLLNLTGEDDSDAAPFVGDVQFFDPPADLSSIAEFRSKLLKQVESVESIETVME